MQTIFEGLQQEAPASSIAGTFLENSNILNANRKSKLSLLQYGTQERALASPQRKIKHDATIRFDDGHLLSCVVESRSLPSRPLFKTCEQVNVLQE